MLKLENIIKKLYRTIVPEQTRRFLNYRYHREMPISEFKIDGMKEVQKDFKERLNYTGPLLSSYLSIDGDSALKWHHYLPVYESILTPFRNKSTSLLELGVAGGGSLQMWKDFLGQEAEIWGIDIDPRCKGYARGHAEVRIGSQSDIEFLRSVMTEMKSLDVVIDDGSHHMQHIKQSFEFLFPRLSDGGIYIIEDLHAAYWKTCGGGYNSNNNFFSYVRDLIDDMHSYYHSHGLKKPDLSEFIHSVTVHDSMCVFVKKKRSKPAWSSMPAVR